MEYVEKIKKALTKELDEYAEKTKFTSSDIEMLYKVTDIVKNLDKIEMLEESGEGYSEGRGGRGRSSYNMGGSSYDDDMMYSERRGRGRNARRDSMGRYSSEGGNSYDEYSEDGSLYGGSYDRGGQNSRTYSRDDAKGHMMHKLGAMMEDADPKEREALKKCMRAIEEA